MPIHTYQVYPKKNKKKKHLFIAAIKFWFNFSLGGNCSNLVFKFLVYDMFGQNFESMTSAAWYIASMKGEQPAATYITLCDSFIRHDKMLAKMKILCMFTWKQLQMK